MLIRDAEVEGARVDVRLEGDRIAEIGAALARRTSVSASGSGPEPGVLDARGGALLPGLHDHHIHVHALAAAGASIACGPPDVGDESQLVAALTAADRAAGTGWLRGVAYHESVAGDLDRHRLDAWVPRRPLRIQHRSGSAWMLNSAGLDAVGLEGGADAPEGVERDADGRATGRLFRLDDWLRDRIASSAPDLAAVGARLAAFGVTGLTDATAHNDAAALARFREAAASGALPQRIHVMGSEDLRPRDGTERVSVGAVKILLDEPRLPGFDELVARMRAAHTAGRGVAVHCVTRAELVFAVEAFRRAGAIAGDRIEHASVAPPELVALVAGLPLTVVTQPHFLRERGDAYRDDVPAADLAWLYRAKAWRDAGVPLGGGSDAPFGSPDPWRAMAAAVDRRTEAGHRLGDDAPLSPEEALALFITSAAAPGGATRRVAVGAVADLCLLDRPWREARIALASDRVAATWCAGALVATPATRAADSE